jgi:hypothetical protein
MNKESGHMNQSHFNDGFMEETEENLLDGKLEQDLKYFGKVEELEVGHTEALDLKVCYLGFIL